MRSVTAPAPEDDLPSYPSNHVLSIRDVCDLTGHDRKTVTGWIHQGRYTNAVQSETGRKGWSIPVRDLVNAGQLDPSQVVEVGAALATLRESRQVTELRSRIVELEAALLVQTALADERRTTVDSLQSLITALLPAVAR